MCGVYLDTGCSSEVLWLFLFSLAFAFFFLLDAFYLKSVSSSWFFVPQSESFRLIKGKGGAGAGGREAEDSSNGIFP